jgi:hypothetical protein
MSEKRGVQEMPNWQLGQEFALSRKKGEADTVAFPFGADCRIAYFFLSPAQISRQ